MNIFGCLITPRMTIAPGTKILDLALKKKINETLTVEPTVKIQGMKSANFGCMASFNL